MTMTMRVAYLTALTVGLLIGAPAQAATTLVGSYDGFCDGFSVKIKKNGAVFGVETGCLSGPIAGAVGRKKQLIVNEDHVDNAVFEILTDPRVWRIIQSNGKILDSGTWSPGAPLSKSKLPSTGGR